MEYAAAAAPTAALVLSEFSGSAASLTGAYVVNPYDDEVFRFGLLAALTAGDDERAQRMASMRQYVSAYDVREWSQNFLNALRPTRHIVPRSSALGLGHDRPSMPHPRVGLPAFTDWLDSRAPPRAASLDAGRAV